MPKYTISPEGAEAREVLAQNLLLGASGILEASSALQEKSLAPGDDLGICGEEITSDL